jgi:REP element-mobilizing transposase RayT
MYLQLAESKDMFLTYINKAKQKYPFQLLNHIRLFIKPEQGQRLSTIMKCLKGNFARYWNKVHDKKSGHLWGKQFFSKIITDVSQFLKVFKDIDKNPMGRCTDGDTLIPERSKALLTGHSEATYDSLCVVPRTLWFPEQGDFPYCKCKRLEEHLEV